jgi:hypothetical protein
MWLKILEKNARKVNGSNDALPDPVATRSTQESPTPHAAGQTDEPPQVSNPKKTVLRIFKKYIELPFFAGAIITILVMGERNLFSRPVRHQTEPLANIGQWGPIVGTALGVVGSLYILLAQAVVLEQSAEYQAKPPTRMEFLRKSARIFLRFSDWIGTPREGFDTGSEYREMKAR